MQRILVVFFVFLAVFLGVSLAEAQRGKSEKLEQLLGKFEELDTKYRADLEKLAKSCEKIEKNEEATKIRQRIIPQAPDKVYIPKFPLKIEPAPDPDKPWEGKFLEIRQTYAQNVFSIVRDLAKEKFGTEALRLSIHALHANPDHASLRTVFGYKKFRNEEWRSDWEIKKSSKYVDHEKFGWVLKTHVKNLESGKRYIEETKKWVTEEEERRIRNSLENGWNVESEHYVVRTTHSLEEGVRISRRLEDYYRAWHLLFYRYLRTDDELCSVILARKPLADPKERSGIVMFKDERDFKRNLREFLPPDGEATGFYHGDAGIGYFYLLDPRTAKKADVEHVERTVIHESSHQLFDKFRKQQGRSKANFWATEAIAVYLESFHEENGYYVFGDTNDSRMLSARYRFIGMKYYIPLFDLASMSPGEFQSFENLAALYSECGGLGHFFMHGENGEYRDKMIAFLQDVYAEKTKVGSLSLFMEKEFDELDKEYAEFITKGVSDKTFRQSLR